MSDEPTSRTVVNPAINVFRAYSVAPAPVPEWSFAAGRACPASNPSGGLLGQVSVGVHEPGSSVGVPRSITSAPARHRPASTPVPWILPATTTTSRGVVTRSDCRRTSGWL